MEGTGVTESGYCMWLFSCRIKEDGGKLEEQQKMTARMIREAVSLPQEVKVDALTLGNTN